MWRTLTLQSIKQSLRFIDWKILLFLILFLNVKLVIKIVALIVIYALRPNFRFHFRSHKHALPLFYLMVIAIAILNGIIYESFYSAKSGIAVCVGIAFWILCLLALQQVKFTVEKTDTVRLHNTILLLFAINILSSFLNIGSIILETGAFNPYRYQGDYQKYFMGTGDYIRGISFDTSTTNAVINAFAVIYFLYREKGLWVVLSMGALLLTASNFTNAVLLCTLFILFVFRSSRNQKSLIVICSVMLVVFLAKVSPHNDRYIITGLNNYLVGNNAIATNASVSGSIRQKGDDRLSEDEMQKVAQHHLDSLSQVEVGGKTTVQADSARTKPVIPSASIHSVPFQRRRDTSEVQKGLIAFAISNKIPLLPLEDSATHKLRLGKYLAARQTFDYFKSHKQELITGTGTGNFSSKLAFRSSALNIAGGYPIGLRHSNDDFKSNHLSLFLSYFTRDRENHSIINTPNSTYDQLLSEYGLLGLAALIIFYIGFFLSRAKKLTYGLPLLLIMCGMFFVEYWFEQLSVVIIFELLLLLDLKEDRKLSNAING